LNADRASQLKASVMFLSMVTNLDKNLSELERDVWDSPEFDSHVVTECHRLRFVALKDFTIEDLRLMIGQNIGLDYLVPLALEHLETNPLIGGDLYPGDLLKNVIGIPKTFWTEHFDLRVRMVPIAQTALRRIGSIDTAIDDGLTRQLNAFSDET
jgi:hypothetical protein